jgi:hypothetical protein
VCVFAPRYAPSVQALSRAAGPGVWAGIALADAEAFWGGGHRCSGCGSGCGSGSVAVWQWQWQWLDVAVTVAVAVVFKWSDLEQY